jgi:hypothetical protein
MRRENGWPGDSRRQVIIVRPKGFERICERMFCGIVNAREALAPEWGWPRVGICTTDLQSCQ